MSYKNSNIIAVGKFKDFSNKNYFLRKHFVHGDTFVFSGNIELVPFKTPAEDIKEVPFLLGTLNGSQESIPLSWFGFTAHRNEFKTEFMRNYLVCTRVSDVLERIHKRPITVVGFEEIASGFKVPVFEYDDDYRCK